MAEVLGVFGDTKKRFMPVAGEFCVALAGSGNGNEEQRFEIYDRLRIPRGKKSY